MDKNEQIHFSFQALQDSSLVASTGKLRNPSIANATDEECGKYTASFRGALLHLFGEPLWTSALMDEAFEYVIQASDSKGTTWILTAYQGPSGPAIGGDPSNHSIYPAAEALLHLIETTQPANFEAVAYDPDTDHTVTYGCKGGICYWYQRSGKHL